MTVTKINNIIDQKTVEVGSYPFSIQAIERECPTEATNSNGVDQRQKPINIKIKIQNTQRKNGQNGIVAARCGSKKLRCLNSDQTIMSFDLVRENTLVSSTRKHGSKFVKLLMPGKCLSSKTNDDDYSYVPSDFEINKNKNKCIANLSKDNKPKLDREDGLPPIIILGKCKPGGCLDPVFSEDKFSYTPTTKTTIKISEDLTRDARTSQDKKETKADNKVGDQITIKQKESPLRTNNVSSEAIITYPIAPSSGEITTTKKSNEKSPEIKNKDDKILKKYQNELTEVFFRPSKTEERSREKSLKENVQYQSILRTGRDIDDVSTNLTTSDDQSNISSDNKNQDGNESTHTLSDTHILSENLESNAENENGSLKSLSKITFPTHDDENNDFIYDSKRVPNKDMNNDTKFLYEDNLKFSENNLKDKTNEVESLSVTSDYSQYLETQKLERKELPISTRHSLPEILSLDAAQLNTNKYIVASKNKSRDDFKKLEPSINRDDSNNILENEDKETNLIQGEILSNASLQQNVILKSIIQNDILKSVNLSTDHNMKSMSETNMDDEKQKSRLSLDNIEKNIIGSKDSEKDLFGLKEIIDRIIVTKPLTESLSPSNTICIPKQNASDERDYNNEVIPKNNNCLSIDSKFDIDINNSKNSRVTEQNILWNSVPAYNIVQENLLSDKDLLNNKSAHEEIYNTRQSSQVFEKTNFEKSEIIERAPALPNLKGKSSNDLHDITTNDINNNSTNKKDDDVQSAGISMEGLESINQKTEERNKSTDSKFTSLQKSPDITVTSALPTTQLIYNSEYLTNENQQNTMTNEHKFEEKNINIIKDVDLLENTILENLSDITTATVFSTHDKDLSDDYQEKDMKSKNINEDDEINNESLNLNNTQSTFAKNIFNELVTDFKEKSSEPFHIKKSTNIIAALPQAQHSLNDLDETSTESQFTNHEKINKNKRRSLKNKPRTLDHEEGQLSIIKEIFESKTLSRENLPLVGTLMYNNFLENVKQEPDQNSLVRDDKIPQEKYESIGQKQSVDISSVKPKETKDEPIRLTAVSNNSPSISLQGYDAFLKITKGIRLDVDEYVSNMDKKDIVENKTSYKCDSVKTLEASDKMSDENYILLNLGFESYVNDNNEKIINTLDPFLKPKNNNKRLGNVIRKTARIKIYDNLTIPIDSDVAINIAINSKKKQKIKNDKDVHKMLPTKKLNHDNIQHLICTLHDHNLVPVKNIMEQLTKDIQFINYNNLHRKIKIKSSIKSLNHKRRSHKCCKCCKRRTKNVISNKTSQE